MAKVAPLKPTTIPRLELCGAQVLARAMDQASNALNLNSCQSFCWTDSTIVLGWLKTNPTFLKPFVCNCVVEIQELTKGDIWNHVPTKSNPADLLSRGLAADQLINSSLWWHGPDWLLHPSSTWPVLASEPDELPEIKQTSHCLIVMTGFIAFHNYSRFSFLVRVIAYCLRFVHNCRTSANGRILGPLSGSEINRSTIQLVKLAQSDSFKEELKLLQRNQLIKTCGQILRLNPFLDEDGVIRVGGRLRNSPFSFDKKYPMLLSGSHRLSYLILSSEHLRLLHAGPQLLLSSVRERFWITSGRNLSNQICRRSATCFRASPKILNPLMGNLSSLRVTPSYAFMTTGVDYAGPLLIKDKKGRGSKTSKAYICLFVCFTSRAVHLELVTSLTTEAFIHALRRFIARRGKPLHIFSNNGTNFIGARRELHELGRFLKDKHPILTEIVATDEINWHFIPPNSPHFGGLWEAEVKSSKQHIKRVIGNTLLTFEEFTTLLSQVEAILNSRPLSPLSCDPNDFNPLTPSHFLIGRPAISTADPSLADIPVSRLSLYQKIQQIQQHFWTRWSKEYISELQTRVKWFKNQHTLAENQMVLIKDDKLHSLYWKLGRIVALHPGSDGISRTASIRTSKGTIKRAFSKICPLPLEEKLKSVKSE